MKRQDFVREVYDVSYKRLVVQLFALTGDLAEAEDAVQEAFVTALDKARAFGRVDNPEAWLRTVALNDHNVYEAARHKVCGADVQLVIDGTPAKHDKRDPSMNGHFTELGARLSSGTNHQVEVKVVRGDPRNIRYAVVVRTQTRIPPPRTP